MAATYLIEIGRASARILAPRSWSSICDRCAFSGPFTAQAVNAEHEQDSDRGRGLAGCANRGKGVAPFIRVRRSDTAIRNVI
jgi:hypothetical protein